jgi:hypothetical protein
MLRNNEGERSVRVLKALEECKQLWKAEEKHVKERKIVCKQSGGFESAESGKSIGIS